MNIKCPQCDTLYDVSEEIANSGAQVQCAKCNDIFTASPAPQPEEIPDIVLEPIAEPEPTPEPEPISEPAQKTEPEPEEPSELLSPEEKEFFTSFGNKLAEAEEAAASQESVAEPSLEDVSAEAAEPAVPAMEEDDIGWVEEDVEEPAATEPETTEPETIDPFEELDTPNEAISFDELDTAVEPDASGEIDLFGDAEPPSEPEPEPEPESQTVEEDLFAPEVAETIAKPEEDLLDDITEPAQEAAQKTRMSQLSPVLVGWGALAASICLIIASATLFRVPIVKAVPGMAGLYAGIGLPVNIRGLEFVGLNHQWMNKNGRMRLVVRGEIINITDDAKPVPQIIFSMLDKGGLEFFQWTEQAGPSSLQGKSRTRFRAQIPAPADRVRQLKIRFAKR